MLQVICRAIVCSLKQFVPDSVLLCSKYFIIAKSVGFGACMKSILILKNERFLVKYWNVYSEKLGSFILKDVVFKGIPCFLHKESDFAIFAESDFFK